MVKVMRTYQSALATKHGLVRRRRCRTNDSVKRTRLYSSLALLLAIWLGSVPSLAAQTPPLLEARLYTGITVTGAAGTAYSIQATTNLAATNAWVTLTNVVLPASPWIYIDYDSGTTARRFYRAVSLPPFPTNMVLIPAGSFQMGDSFSEGNSYEGPVHTVNVSTFYIDKYDVTKEFWDQIYQWATNHGYSFDNGGFGKTSGHPV